MSTEALAGIFVKLSSISQLQCWDSVSLNTHITNTLQKK